MKLYLSGPMTSLPEFNYPAFNRAAQQLRANGFTVVNPAELGEAAGPGHPWADYMRHSLKGMLDCDAVAVLPGWEDSRGATIEVDLAGELGMPVKEVAAFLAERQSRVKEVA